MGEKNIRVTFNPSTQEGENTIERQFKNVLKAIDSLKETKIIFTNPKPDRYAKAVTRLIKRYVAKNRDRAALFASMGRELYLSALQFVDAVVGNSSSGIIEAPSFGIPTVNIGDREKGRIKGDTVIDVKENERSVKKALRKALSEEFKRLCRDAEDLYGDGNTSRKMVDIVKRIPFTSSRKKFLDLDFVSPKLKKRRLS